MAEGSKLRLVRCPRCDNLLPELPEYSVYQCGGCGTILRAKKRDPGSDVLSEKSEEDNKGLGCSEKLVSSVECGSDNINFASGVEMEDSGTENSWRRKERVFVEKKTNFVNSSFQRTEKKEILVREDLGVSEEFKDLRLVEEEKEYGTVDNRYNRFSEHEMDQWSSGANRYAGMNRPQSVKSNIEETSTQPNKVVGSLRTRPRMDWSSVERGRFPEKAKMPNVSYADEGPSNYDPYAFHGRSRGNMPGEVEKLEQERAELLRKLDELKDQLNRSYHVPDLPKEREPIERNFPRAYGNQDAYDAATRNCLMDKSISRPPPYFVDHSHEGVPFVNRHHNVDALNFYSPRSQSRNKIPEYEDPFPPQMTRKPHHQLPHQYPRVSPHEYYSPHTRNFDIDPFGPYPHHESLFHAPSCACMACYNRNSRAPPRVPTHKSGPVSHNSNFYRHEDPINIEPHGPPMQSRDPQRHTRRPIDFDSEINSHYHPRRTAGTQKIGRFCGPIGGGAPFIACQKCFELLKLPRRKLRKTGIHKQKLRCGACSAVILLKVENEKLIASAVTELKHSSPKEHQHSAEVLNDSIVSSGSPDGNCVSSCSEDFRKSSFNFQSAVSEQCSLIEENERLNLEAPEKGLPLSPSISSREEESILSAIELGELPLKSVSSPVPPRTPMWQESDSPRCAISRDLRLVEENENEDKIFGRINYRDDLVRDLAEANELDVSFNEYQHESMSHDFAELSKEYQLRLSKGSDSFLVGFIKKSLRDISRSSHSMETERPKVYINGHPLLDRVVKRAEKYAGPIRPGDYWYDYKAGFWGVMGQPCLGIIPPSIEEFNYPMPANCGAGNTSVYVNGRELNQRDLDLLASRGLPAMRNKFYIVEINGKVIDEDTGKELDNLGKLAPTVERVKHGFGMKVPRVVS